MRENDANALRAYLDMIHDGDAFSNWDIIPNSITRRRIIESIMGYKKFNGRLNTRKIRKVIQESTNEKELKSMFENMKIKEDEFKI